MKMKFTLYTCILLCTLASQAIAADAVQIIPFRKSNRIEVPAADGNAAVGDVVIGKTFSSQNGENITGTLASANGTATKKDVKSTATFSSSLDSGTGTRIVPTGATAPLMVSGQTSGYGDIPYGAALVGVTDGQLQKGAELASIRFLDNEDGTVLDTMTGLTWLTNANCFGQIGWSAAFTAVNTLADGTCGLTDGSVAGDWRVPNVLEIQSILNYEYGNPALSNSDSTGQWTSGDPFTKVQSGNYLTSTTIPKITTNSYVVSLGSGLVTKDTYKGNAVFIWPVRD